MDKNHHRIHIFYRKQFRLSKHTDADQTFEKTSHIKKISPLNDFMAHIISKMLEKIPKNGIFYGLQKPLPEVSSSRKHSNCLHTKLYSTKVFKCMGVCFEVLPGFAVEGGADIVQHPVTLIL